MGYLGAALGAVMGGVGAAQQAGAEKSQLKQTQRNYEMRGQAARSIADAQEQSATLRGKEVESAGVASAAGSGVDVGSGSALSVLLRNARMTNYNARLAGYNNRLDAWSSDYGASQAKATRKYVGRMEPYSIATGVIGGAMSGFGGGISPSGPSSSYGGGGGGGSSPPSWGG